MAPDDFDLHRRRRALFTNSATAYDEGRPGYPPVVFDRLRDVCGLGDGMRVLEIGPGTGQATGPLLDAGAEVTAIELGSELAARLAEKHGDRRLTVVVRAFEDVDIEPAGFDLIAAATSFHWIPPQQALPRCHELLAPGGWLGLWWNVFGDPDRPDPFHDAIQPLLEELAPQLRLTFSTPNAGTGAHAHALEVDERIAEMDATRLFGPVRQETIAWAGTHTSTEIRDMFASFSPWLALDPTVREPLLDGLVRIAEEEFDGIVERPYLTPIYLAPRMP